MTRALTMDAATDVDAAMLFVLETKRTLSTSAYKRVTMTLHNFEKDQKSDAWARKHHCKVDEHVPADCPEQLFRLPCGWNTTLSHQAWMRADRTVRTPWQICRAPGAGKTPKTSTTCDETVVRVPIEAVPGSLPLV